MKGKFSAVLAAALAASVSAAAFASCAQPAQPGGPDAEGLPQARPARGFGMYPAAAGPCAAGPLRGWDALAERLGRAVSDGAISAEAGERILERFGRYGRGRLFGLGERGGRLGGPPERADRHWRGGGPGCGELRAWAGSAAWRVPDRDALAERLGRAVADGAMGAEAMERMLERLDRRGYGFGDGLRRGGRVWPRCAR